MRSFQKVVKTLRIVDVRRGHGVVPNPFTLHINADMIFAAIIAPIPLFRPASIDVFLRFFGGRPLRRDFVFFLDVRVFFARIVLSRDLLKHRVDHLPFLGAVAVIFQVSVENAKKT